MRGIEGPKRHRGWTAVPVSPQRRIWVSCCLPVLNKKTNVRTGRKENKKVESWEPLRKNLKFCAIYLKLGTGKPWPAQIRAFFFPFWATERTISELGNFGFVLPTGSRKYLGLLMSILEKPYEDIDTRNCIRDPWSLIFRLENCIVLVYWRSFIQEKKKNWRRKKLPADFRRSSIIKSPKAHYLSNVEIVPVDAKFFQNYGCWRR